MHIYLLIVARVERQKASLSFPAARLILSACLLNSRLAQLATMLREHLTTLVSLSALCNGALANFIHCES